MNKFQIKEKTEMKSIPFSVCIFPNAPTGIPPTLKVQKTDTLSHSFNSSRPTNGEKKLPKKRTSPSS